MKNVTLCLLLGCSLSLGGNAVAAPKKVVAGPESTVYGIAYENGILTRALIAANNLQPPYALQPGQVLIIPSPDEHIAGKGETLQTIAEEYGVNVDVLAQENDARSVKPGERLSIPSRDTESLAEAMKPPTDSITTSSLEPLPSVKSAPPPSSPRPLAASAPPVEKIHVPASDSKQEHFLPNELAAEIAQEKGTIDGNAQKEKVDTSSKPMLIGNLVQGNAGAPTAATTTVKAEEEIEKPKKEKIVGKKEKLKKEQQVAEKKPVPATEESPAEIPQPQFIWPAKGTISGKFSPGKNDGIKIKIPEGTDVKAAAAGDVLYAGSELKGFGNLLLIKHKGGWVTAYAYNSSLLVKKGDTVKQGQVVAKSGKTGDATEPQLHFEVRKGKQPVDPLGQLES